MIWRQSLSHVSILFLLFAMALKLSESRFLEDPSPSSSSSSSTVNENLSDTFQYLNDLQRMYSTFNRPKERRVGNNMASALKKLSQIKDFYNEAGRPRFGKRSGSHEDLPWPAL
eukprot:TRINITY_DN7602_c0_g1_i1.p1 TRINITY_DN7602_c0_g1~~TRINITY_DN7602_c0_g1_i1.p1  ORF type:complete len:114 (+),score=30.05 TRINITY_DN7602_c0_g1_i1:32-373(+)